MKVSELFPFDGFKYLLRLLGMYKGGAFKFSFAINTNYPHDPPKVKCAQTVCLTPISSCIPIESLIDLSPKRGPGGQRLLEHPPRGLEACP